MATRINTAGMTDDAAVAFREYLRLGPGRSLSQLVGRTPRGAAKPITTRIATIKDWSRQYDWVERARVYDAERAEKVQAVRERAEEQPTPSSIRWRPTWRCWRPRARRWSRSAWPPWRG